MKAKQVTSSSVITEVKYYNSLDAMKINFNNGSEYLYFDVSFGEYMNLITADSVGSHFNKEVRGMYEFRKIL